MRSVISTLIVAGVVLSGCAWHARPSAAPVAEGPAPAPSIAPATAIRYAEYLNPAALRPEQLTEIEAEAEKARPAGRDVWFVLVLSNRLYQGKWDYRAIVYFTPDETSPRLRKGRYLGVSSLFLRYRDRLPKHDAELSNYVQVSLPDKPFGEVAEVPWGPELPFDPPEEVAEADLVPVLDAARRIIGATPYIGDCNDRFLPIQRFDVNPGEIRVLFGWQVGPLAGGGVVVTVRKTKRGFVADRETGVWDS